MNFRLTLVVLCFIGLSFLLYIRRPYSITSDIAYQVLSAQQYVEHTAPALNSLRLVNPRDLSQDVITYLTFWAPAWPLLFVAAFKVGMAPGTAGRVLVVLLSVAGAMGWLWVISLLPLWGKWKIAGAILAGLYCLRTGLVSSLGAGDLLIYAVAPWLLGASMLIAGRLRTGFNRRTAALTTLLCLALGCVYWLKYSGIFFSIPVFCALLLEHVRVRPRSTALWAAFVLYGTALVLPIIANKLYNYQWKGTDLMEAATPHSPLRTFKRFRTFCVDNIYYASTTLFSPEAGVMRVTRDRSLAVQWMARFPGILLLIVLLYLLYLHPATYLRNLTGLLLVVPLVGFPVLSFITGPHFVVAIGRCCEPFWILAELFVFLLLSRAVKPVGAGVRPARAVLAAAAGSQLLLFLWMPYSLVQDLLITYRRPPYEAGAAKLYIPDISRKGTTEVDAAVKSDLRNPSDLVVPATYSNRSFGMDMWIEFGGRLLPLTIFDEPLIQTHGKEGANFYGSTPFITSHPLRVVLVVSNIYERADFSQLVQHIKNRFTQARQWVKGPLGPDRHIEIWVADLQ